MQPNIYIVQYFRVNKRSLDEHKITVCVTMTWLTFCWKPLLLVSKRTWYQTSHDYSFGWRFWANAAAHTNIYCAHLHLFTITTSRTNPHKVDMNRGQTAERLITVRMETRASLYVQRNIFTLTQPENRRIFVDSLKHTNTLYLHILQKVHECYSLSLGSSRQ